MLIAYLRERWKNLLRTYVIGTGLLFGIFYVGYFFSEPVYRTKFSINPKANVLPVSHIIENLFELLSTKDSLSFSNRLNLTRGQIRSIKSVKYDILNGDFIEIDISARDTQIILPFYHGLIDYLNSDSILNSENNYTRSKLEKEMELINLTLEKLDTSGTDIQPFYWNGDHGGAGFSLPVQSRSMNRVFLSSMLSNLEIQHFNLMNVRPLNSPVIPQRPLKISVVIYLIFSNLIVLSLMFVQFLIRTNKSDGSS